MNIFKKKNDKTKIKQKSIGKNYSIDKKVKDFINWYFNTFIKGHHSKIGEFEELRKMINAIEKMAVWYELRYPEDEIKRRYSSLFYEEKNYDNIFEKQNPIIKQIKEILDGDERKEIKKIINMLKWENLLSPKAYISSLSWNERWFLARQKFNNIVYINDNNHLHLTAKGRINQSEIIKNANDKKISCYNFNGWHIQEVIDYLKKINYPIENKEILEAVASYKKRNELKERFLDIVMYRIIERGGTIIGPRRAFMFALDFKRNIDIPIIYGIDYSDPGLREFINEYIKAGGHLDLECLINYGSRKSNNETLKTVTVKEIIKTVWASAESKYTKEEIDLYQRLVNVLAGEISIEEEKREEEVNKKSHIKQKRLIGKLSHSR